VIDTDVELIWDYLRHIHPEFSLNHVLVYKSLWRVEPKNGEDIIGECGLARATTYKILKELVNAGLVKKTGFKPIGYYAKSPVKDYYNYSRKLIKKLEKGKEELKKVLNNSSSLSGEIYLIKRDGGQQRLLIKKSRQTIKDEQQLNEIKKAVDHQLNEINQSKNKAWQLVGRV